MLLKLKGFLYQLLLTYKYSVGKAKVYHEGQGKSRFRILLDLLLWQTRELDFNTMYYAYGLNLFGSRQKKYIGRREFLQLKNKTEEKRKVQAGCKDFNYDVITKDKFIANSIFIANNIPCVENIAIYCNSILIYRGGEQSGIDGFLKFDKGFILKNIVLEGGDGVLVCNVIDDKIETSGVTYNLSSFANLLGKHVWVVQNKYESSKEIKRINSTALNTTRIVTIMNNNKPEYLCGFQAFATGGATTDSWSKGSVYVGIDVEMETLNANGYFNLSDKLNSLSTEHPDSGIVFESYKIPGLKDAVELCIKAHSILYFNFAIGWDIAITEIGPLIVEANERPGMNVVQCMYGGLKNKIYQYSKTFECNS